MRVISTSLKITRPARAGVNPTIDRHSVVLPTPLRPNTATTVPALTVSVTPCRTWLSP